jgi:polar amino acid transport system substrate-binding protein
MKRRTATISEFPVVTKGGHTLSRKYKVLVALLLAVALVFSVAAVAGCKPKNALQAILKAGKIIVGTSADYPPFEFVDEATGNYTGFDIELMEMIAEEMGVTVEWKDMTFDIVLNSLQSGQINAAIAAMSIDPERQEQALFSNPYWESPNAVLVKVGSTVTITDPLVDFPALLIGVQSGTIHEKYVKTELIDVGKMDAANLSSYPRADQAILDLVAGRLDAVYMDDAAAQAFTVSHPVVIAMVHEVDSGMGIAVMLGEQELIDKINEILTQLTEDGSIEALGVEYDIAKTLTEGG